MKKIYTLIAAMLLVTGGLFAQSCTPDNSDNTVGYTPPPASLPCIDSGVAYNQTIQAKIPSSYDSTISVSALGQTFNVAITVIIDSVQLDTVNGLPAGIQWAKSPNVLDGGHVGCVNFYGTTTAAAGQYDLTGIGTVWTHDTGTIPVINRPFDTAMVYHGSLNQYPGFGNYYLKVCSSVSGINNYNAELNSIINV